MAYSFVPEQLSMATESIQFVSSDTTYTAQVLNASSIQSIATALGDGFSYESVNMNGKRICMSVNTQYNSSNQKKCEGNANFPTLKFNANPNLRMIFYSNYSSSEAGLPCSSCCIWFYDMSTSDQNPIFTAGLQYGSNKRWHFMNVYSINANVKALAITAGSASGCMIFYDDFIIVTGSDYNNVSGAKDGWSFIDKDNVVYKIVSLYGSDPFYIQTSGGAIAFEKLFIEEYPAKKFDGILAEIRGNVNVTQVITKSGISYLILGGHASEGNSTPRATLAISSEILG